MRLFAFNEEEIAELLIGMALLFPDICYWRQLARAFQESHDRVLLEPHNDDNFYWFGRWLQAQDNVEAA